MRKSIIAPDISHKKSPYFLPLLVTFLLVSSCDSEQHKLWEKWRVAAREITHQCGRLGDYEIKIKKEYFFFWPTYDVWSGWDSNEPPPPLDCSAKLRTMSIEAIWPGIVPDGRKPVGYGEDPSHITISISTVPDVTGWDLMYALKRKLEIDQNSSFDFLAYKFKETGLYSSSKSYRRSSLSTTTYYWEIDATHRVNTIIECETSDNKTVDYCDQAQYLPALKAIIHITYKRSQLSNWKGIAQDVFNFVLSNST